LLIVDAGPLFAVAAAGDPNHERCVALLTRAPGPLVVPALVIAEVAYLMGDRLGAKAELAFGRALADGELVVGSVEASDLQRMAELAGQYVDLPLGLVDASVIALAERLEVRSIATLDHRHFSTVRPNHVAAFELLP
jgi:predicted nucleic acid-binding protein